MIYLKTLFLFLGILFTFVNLVRGIHGSTIPAINFILQMIGYVGFIYCQWLI